MDVVELRVIRFDIWVEEEQITREAGASAGGDLLADERGELCLAHMVGDE